MKLIATLVAIYVVICVIAYLSNRAFMYFPDPTRVAPSKAGLVDVDEVELEAGDAVTLVAWYTAANKNKSTILYFHGNGANAAERASRIATMREDGFGVFYLNNRGYGGSEGRPTEQNNVADAVAAYDHLRSLGVPKEKIVAYGESLGSGQSIRLASERPVAAIVLESPLTSTIDVARSTYFWLPLEWLITDTYNNEDNIRSVSVPVLVLHGAQDETIPVEMGRRVYQAAKQPKEVAVFPRGTHVDLFKHGAWEATKDFIARIIPGTEP
jgi:fermentation-respiration switch protein FrsA (DUF1100 family)